MMLVHRLLFWADVVVVGVLEVEACAAFLVGVVEALLPVTGVNGSGVCLDLLMCAISGSAAMAPLLLPPAVAGILTGASGNMMPANMFANGTFFKVGWLMRDLRDFRMGRVFEFTGSVSRHEIRHYEIDARGELSLRLVVGLGYDGEYLRDVIVYVTKVDNDVPDRHVGATVDIVECMVRLVTTAILSEHGDYLSSIVEWEAILDAPLVGRGYMRGVLQL
ncbi:hypothetical protein CBR_g68691 [Chara braunii]|uniref:Uncharacterized protein n=1 Tax=Chara braunii TaxID=69332 RepID=A0A388K9K4_CHABU|nr:hypothetical protein CBR_g68691 [Chara braunii]|eukprot:GBG66707.1 hypothetical protein CBR_g68691 [Chara braunii]